MKILILGANGFIGSNLCYRLLKDTEHKVVAVDMKDDNYSLIKSINDEERFIDYKFDVFNAICRKGSGAFVINKLFDECDLVINLIAIATPDLYIKRPIRVFELDFELAFAVLKKCFFYKKKLLFPSTSEIYGMNENTPFEEDISYRVLGPTKNQRWIYSSCKALAEHLMHAFGDRGLDYVIVRFFNMIGPRLDRLDSIHQSGARVIIHFMNALINNENIKLVNGGLQTRSFCYIRDGIDCLLSIIEKFDDVRGMTFNIGNGDPACELSMMELAIKMTKIYNELTGSNIQNNLEAIKGHDFYGKGYQDTQKRVPSVQRAKYILGYEPKVDIDEALRRTIHYFLLEERIIDKPLISTTEEL